MDLPAVRQACIGYYLTVASLVLRVLRALRGDQFLMIYPRMILGIIMWF